MILQKHLQIFECENWKPIYFVSNSGKKSSNEKKEKNTHSFIIQKYI